MQGRSCRTKRGQGRIEDINFSPRSIGIFPVAPGGQLRTGTVIDVYGAAQAERNPGAARRLDMRQWKVDNTVPDIRVP